MTRGRAITAPSPPSPPAPDAAEAPFRATALGVRYGRKVALDGVSLDVHRGRVTALIGPSGCGKTTFLCCLNRLTDLIPDCVVTGALHMGATDVLDPGLDVVEHRRDVGMIFQKPNPFPTSITRNIELPLHEHGVRDRAERRRIVEQSLRDVGLFDEVKDRLRGSALGLSGGQQQRLCIARALALRPHVLLMDEPCSSLDPIASGVVEDLIASLRARVTVVIVTHNLAQARRIADDVAVFWLRDGSGRLIESGPAARVLHAPDDPTTASYVHGERG